MSHLAELYILALELEFIGADTTNVYADIKLLEETLQIDGL